MPEGNTCMRQNKEEESDSEGIETKKCKGIKSRIKHTYLKINNSFSVSNIIKQSIYIKLPTLSFSKKCLKADNVLGPGPRKPGPAILDFFS